MRIAISGASGFIGHFLVRHLANQGFELVLLGRCAERLRLLFPDHVSYEYSDLNAALQEIDVILHAAAAVPNKNLNAIDFKYANFELTKTIVNKAIESKVKRLIYFSSTHALSRGQSAYATSKADADQFLSVCTSLRATILRLPTVYSDEFRGRLAVLNKLPKLFRKPAFQILAAFRPTVHIGQVLNAVDVALVRSDIDEHIVSDRQAGNWVYQLFKYLVDYGFAIAVILLLWWLMIVIYTAVRITSKGPGIFSQSRIGRNRCEFTCYKFRTMQVDTKTAGTHEVSSASITRIGAFLRRTKLDELPQVINILRGEISLVGPRPCLPIQSDLIEARNGLEIYSILPGITGMAQVNGVDMSQPEKLATWDAKYLAFRSIPLDIKIIIATFLGHGLGDRTIN